MTHSVKLVGSIAACDRVDNNGSLQRNDFSHIVTTMTQDFYIDKLSFPQKIAL